MKVATDDLTASWIRDEHLVYSMLRGPAFMPGLPGVLRRRDPAGPRARGPLRRPLAPALGPDRVRAVLECLDAVASTPPPDGLPSAADDHLGLRLGWREIAEDPEPFLRLGLCSGPWLEAALPTLLEAARGAPLEGPALLHFDVRSDNVCFRSGGAAVLVDWNWTSVGNAVARRRRLAPEPARRGGTPPRGGGAGRACRSSPPWWPRTSAPTPAGRRSRRRRASARCSGSRRGRPCPGPRGRSASPSRRDRSAAAGFRERPAQARCASSAASGSRRRRTTDTTNATTNSAEAVSTTAGPEAQFR